MSALTRLCMEITEVDMTSTVDGIVMQKRAGKTGNDGKFPMNFVIKDSVGDTANVVYWYESGDYARVNADLNLGKLSNDFFATLPNYRNSSYHSACRFHDPWTGT